MSKLTGKTTKWLKDAAQKYIDGMPAVTDANRKRLMQIGLDAVRDELQRRTQKKSDPQPSANQGQLPQEKPDPMYQPTTEKEKEEGEYQQFMEQKIQETQPGLLEQVINLIAPPSSPEQIIEIEIDGIVESYGLEELRDKARTWFTQTAEGAAIQKGKGKLEKSVQYRRLCAVVPNWEQFYGYKPKVQDLHRRHNLHGEAIKNAAIRLLQILTA